MFGASDWTSLEIVKVVVGVLTPLALFGLGLMVTQASRRFETARWTNQKVIERRLTLFGELCPKLNDLFCFFVFVGRFWTISPEKALDLKRDSDGLFRANEWVFSPEFGASYAAFMDACFRTATGVGQTAQLRTSLTLQRKERGTDAWDESWDSRIKDEPRWATYEHVERTYDGLLDAVSRELGIDVRERPKRKLPYDAESFARAFEGAGGTAP